VIEILFRLGLALLMSLGLAVLLAWSWDQSEPLTVQSERTTETLSTTIPGR